MHQQNDAADNPGQSIQIIESGTGQGNRSTGSNGVETHDNKQRFIYFGNRSDKQADKTDGSGAFGPEEYHAGISEPQHDFQQGVEKNTGKDEGPGQDFQVLFFRQADIGPVKNNIQNQQGKILL